MTALSDVNLSDNCLSGEVPSQLSSLTGMLMLDLGGNYLTGFMPREIYSMPGRKYFGEQKCRFENTSDMSSFCPVQPRLRDGPVWDITVVDWCDNPMTRVWFRAANTISMAKEQVAQTKGIPVECQRLFLGDVELDSLSTWDLVCLEKYKSFPIRLIIIPQKVSKKLYPF